MKGWSTDKKHWCCKNKHMGCYTMITTMVLKMVPVVMPKGMQTTSAPYDCNAGFSNWEAGWSAPKKVYCCAHAGRGCT